MKVVLIIQARMTSTRLPGKVLRKVMGVPLLEYQILRLKRCKQVDQLVVATTENETDKPVIDLCDKLSIATFRGSENDVLSRYHGAAKEHKADIVVRVTADCPIIDPLVVDKVIKYYLDNSDKYDYVSNSLEKTYPRGMDVEVFPYSVLDAASKGAKSTPEREHVTPFIYKKPSHFRLANVAYHRDHSRHRWTVDENKDFNLIEKILINFKGRENDFSFEECLLLLQAHPEWEKINSNVEQKVLAE